MTILGRNIIKSSQLFAVTYVNKNRGVYCLHHNLVYLVFMLRLIFVCLELKFKCYINIYVMVNVSQWR